MGGGATGVTVCAAGHSRYVVSRCRRLFGFPVSMVLAPVTLRNVFRAVLLVLALAGTYMAVHAVEARQKAAEAALLASVHQLDSVRAERGKVDTVRIAEVRRLTDRRDTLTMDFHATATVLSPRLALTERTLLDRLVATHDSSVAAGDSALAVQETRIATKDSTISQAFAQRDSVLHSGSRTPGINLGVGAGVVIVAGRVHLVPVLAVTVPLVRLKPLLFILKRLTGVQ